MVCSFHFKGLLFRRLIGIVRLQVASFCVLERRKGRVKEVKKRGIEGKEPLVRLNGGELGADRKVIENGERLGVESRYMCEGRGQNCFQTMISSFQSRFTEGRKGRSESVSEGHIAQPIAVSSMTQK